MSSARIVRRVHIHGQKEKTPQSEHKEAIEAVAGRLFTENGIEAGIVRPDINVAAAIFSM